MIMIESQLTKAMSEMIHTVVQARDVIASVLLNRECLLLDVDSTELN